MVKKARRHSQSGHAAMLFAIMAPALLSIFILGTDGTKALQSKARMTEAIEVAGLAVTAQNSDSQSKNQETVANYLNYFFPDAEIDSNAVKVVKVPCDENSACDENDKPYTEYRITATLTEKTWFGSDDSAIISFGDDYNVSEYAVSRKFQGEALDIILVADFSASMYESWSGGHQRKFQDLKDVIKDVADEIQNYNDTDNQEDSTMGLVGFDFYSSHYTHAGARKFYSHLYCTQYREIYSYYGNLYYRPWRSSPNGLCYSKYPMAPDMNRLDVSATLSNLFDESATIHSYGWADNVVTNVSYFRDIALTSDIDAYKSQVASNTKFRVPQATGSGTFFLAGLIRAAQMIRYGDNTRRLIIILSDGQDSYTNQSNNFTDRLINAGICNVIKEKLASDTTSGGKDIKASLAVIGFDYSVSSFPQLSNCVGSDNIYEAEDKDAIKRKILELISEEIGHLASPE